MALFKKEELRHGNIRKMIEVEVSNISVKCPICNTFEDAYVDFDLDITEIMCGCGMDEHTQELDDANEIIEAREERIDDLEAEVKDLEKEVERLGQELMNAKR